MYQIKRETMRNLRTSYKRIEEDLCNVAKVTKDKRFSDFLDRMNDVLSEAHNKDLEDGYESLS